MVARLKEAQKLGFQRAVVPEATGQENQIPGVLAIERVASLSSLVAPEAGHITQICVAASHRGMGIGYELLRQSLLGLHKAGCRSATLTVTDANREAVGLYERVGFETIRRFRAFVWEGF